MLSPNVTTLITCFVLYNTATAEIKGFEKGFLRYMHERKPEIVEKLRTEKKWSDQIAADIKAAIQAYRSSPVSSEARGKTLAKA